MVANLDLIYIPTASAQCNSASVVSFCGVGYNFIYLDIIITIFLKTEFCIAIQIVFNIGHRQNIMFLNYLLTKHLFESAV